MLPASETCIIVGAGSGLSTSLARLFKAEEMTVVLLHAILKNLQSCLKRSTVNSSSVTLLMLSK